MRKSWWLVLVCIKLAVVAVVFVFTRGPWGTAAAAMISIALIVAAASWLLTLIGAKRVEDGSITVQTAAGYSRRFSRFRFIVMLCLFIAALVKGFVWLAVLFGLLAAMSFIMQLMWRKVSI
ncbi:MAG: hypothetical protein ABFD64_05865 [Armatimonadota bacterium]